MSVRFLSGVNIDSNTLFVDDANNRVGIGTNSPSRQLELVGSDAYIQLTRSSTSTQATLGFNTGATNDWLIRTGDGSTSNLQFYSYGTSSYVMTIARSSGNVGIGTTSPSTTLDVLGKIKLGLDGTYGGSDYVTIGFGGTSNGYNRVFGYNGTSDGLYLTSATGHGISFRTNGGSTDNMFINSAGNVGIGTTSPAAKLHVVGTESRFGGVASGYVSVYNANSRSGYLQANEGSDFRIASDTNDMTFYVNGSERVRFTAGGNVGIGTTSPSYKLDVYGDIRSGGADPLMILQPDSGTYAFFQKLSSSNGNYLRLYDGTNYSTFWKDGNVGIGTTAPSSLLSLSKSGLVDFQLNASDQATDEKNWVWQAGASVGAGVYRLRAVNDAYTNGVNAVTFTRSGISSVTAAFSGSVTASSLIKSGGTSSQYLMADGSVSTTSNVAPRYVATVNVSQTAYTQVCTIVGGSLASAVNMSFQGTSGNVVVNVTAQILVNHFQDIVITTTSGFYSQLNIRVISNNNESYSVEAQVISAQGQTTDLNIEVFPLNSESVTFGGSPLTPGTTLVHTTRSGVYVSATEPMSISSGSDIYAAGNVGIGTTSPSQALHVSGNARVTGAYYDSSNSAGSSGQVLSSTGSGTDWVSLSEITGVDGTGTANYVAKWSDTDTITNSQIRDDGTTVGVGQAPAAAKMSVNGALNVGGRYLYNNFQSSLDTTGVAVAGLSASTNGDSAFFTFEAGASNGQYQRIVWSCYNTAGDWNVVKVIDEGTNAFDVVASASSGATITFTWKSRSGALYYTPRLIITGVGSINTSYL